MDVFETDPQRLAQRQKQIDYGKNTIGYERYLQAVPKHLRKRIGKDWDPPTPDITMKASKKGWDGIVRVWRRHLHKYDHLSEQEAAAAGAALEMHVAAERASPAERQQPREQQQEYRSHDYNYGCTSPAKQQQQLEQQQGCRSHGPNYSCANPPQRQQQWEQQQEHRSHPHGYRCVSPAKRQQQCEQQQQYTSHEHDHGWANPAQQQQQWEQAEQYRRHPHEGSWASPAKQQQQWEQQYRKHDHYGSWASPAKRQQREQQWEQQQEYDSHGHHGWTAGQTPGYPAKRLQRELLPPPQQQPHEDNSRELDRGWAAGQTAHRAEAAAAIPATDGAKADCSAAVVAADAEEHGRMGNNPLHRPGPPLPQLTVEVSKVAAPWTIVAGASRLQQQLPVPQQQLREG